MKKLILMVFIIFAPIFLFSQEDATFYADEIEVSTQRISIGKGGNFYTRWYKEGSILRDVTITISDNLSQVDISYYSEDEYKMIGLTIFSSGCELEHNYLICPGLDKVNENIDFYFHNDNDGFRSAHVLHDNGKSKISFIKHQNN